MRIIDVSVPVRLWMVTYPGDPEVRLERVESIADGAHANVSRLDLGAYGGNGRRSPSPRRSTASGSRGGG